jgi:hypothetical protein
MLGFPQKLLKFQVVHLFKVYQQTKFHGPTLTTANFASTSEVRMSCHFGVVEGKGLKYDIKVILNDMISLLNFIQMYQLVQTLLGKGDTHRQNGDLISHTLHFKVSILEITQWNLEEPQSMVRAKTSLLTYDIFATNFSVSHNHHIGHATVYVTTA